MKRNGSTTGFFTSCGNTMWQETINTLSRQGYQFTYICGDTKYFDQIDEKDSIVFHDIYEAMRGIFPVELAGDISYPVDKDLLSNYQEVEFVCLDMADRMDMGYCFSFQERERLYLSCLEFCLYLVTKLKPDFIVFVDNPHSVFEYVLFQVCKKFQVKTLIFRWLRFLGVVSIFSDAAKLDDELVREYKTLEKLVDSGEKVNLPEYLEAYFDRQKNSYDKAMPKYLQDRLAQEKERVQTLSRRNSKYYLDRLRKVEKYPGYVCEVINSISNKVNLHYKRTFGLAPKNYLKRRGEPIESSYISGWEWSIYKFKVRRYKRKLMKEYKARCEPLDYSKPFIYVPLQFQPERTSTPEAGRYTNQLLMVSMLSKFIPSGWMIYVKENPSQLLTQFMHGERGRYTYYYDDLLKLKNVRLVEIQESTFKLIDGCKAVATMTGTTGWESVVRGKPAIVFGSAWYRGCAGVFYTPEIAGLKLAIERIESGDNLICHEKVRGYLLALHNVGFKGFTVPKRANPDISEMKLNIENLVKGITKRLDSANISVVEGAQS